MADLNQAIREAIYAYSKNLNQFPDLPFQKFLVTEHFLDHYVSPYLNVTTFKKEGVFTNG